ncbi:MAG: hypothetical protein AAF135_14115 [Bacteroidota bacterium]
MKHFISLLAVGMMACLCLQASHTVPTFDTKSNKSAVQGLRVYENAGSISQMITSGDTVYINYLSSRDIRFEAQVAPGRTVGSITFDIAGPTNRTFTDDFARYITPVNGGAGTYTLTLIPNDMPGRMGVDGIERTFEVTLLDTTTSPIPSDQVTGLRVYENAGSINQLISNGDTIMISNLGNRDIRVEALTSPQIVNGSLLMDIKGPSSSTKIENYFRYIAPIGNPLGAKQGTYSVTITPYGQGNIGGNPGISRTFTFTLLDAMLPPPPPTDTIPTDTIPVDTIPLDTTPVDTTPVDTLPPDQLPDEFENDESAGEVFIIGNPETEFQPLFPTVSFGITGATFNLDSTLYGLVVNGREIFGLESFIGISPAQVDFPVPLVRGQNDVVVFMYDDAGFVITEEFTLWAGKENLNVLVRDANNQPIDDAIVTVSLSDDPDVQATDTSFFGNSFFRGLPDRTLLIRAVTSDNKIATAATVGGGTVTLSLIDLNPPSTIDNNDLSLGTLGWDIGTAPVQIIPHIEGPLDSSGLSQSGFTPITNSTPGPNNDIELRTSGEGAQMISRTFNTGSGTQRVKVRYRFVTAEVPGGFFGSRFNDYYAVSVRSQNAGASASDQNSMNGLGLAAFDGAGATGWREVIVPVNSSGDVVQVDVTVANVGDDLLDSRMIVDFIELTKLSIKGLFYRDIDNRSLNYLSLAPHSYFGGNTRVHGRFTIEGAEDDSVTNVSLQIVQGSTVLAEGSLVSSVESLIYQKFGSDEEVKIPTNRLIFEIPGAGNYTSNTDIQLKLNVTSKDGGTVSRTSRNRGVLTQYTGTNRYGGRDGGEGGDDWILPEVKPIADNLPTGWLVGDISNMNGGRFIGHGSHRKGNDVDAWFPGYNRRDSATAQTIIDYLNSTDGARITKVYVTFTAATKPDFYNVIQNDTLDDGRKTSTIVRNASGHTTHLHLRVTPNLPASTSPRIAETTSVDHEAAREAIHAKVHGPTLAVQPNPLKMGSPLLITGKADAGTLNVRLLDMQGKLISETTFEVEEAGPVTFKWRLENQENLPEGVYLIQMLQPQHTPQNQKIVITH